MIHRASLFYFIVQFLCCLCGDENTSQPHVTDGDPIDELQDCENYKFKNCSELSNLCLQCDKYDSQCTYGEWSNVTCKRKQGVTCEGGHEIVKEAQCVFCYQTEKWEHTCSFSQNQACSLQTKYYRANCTANPEVMCLGPRKFSMRLRCNITRGHRWSTALLLSITLGGFGADRFYLGHWQEGIGKLFSFGGLGVWTLVDVLLIAIRYLGPADGSLYV